MLQNLKTYTLYGSSFTGLELTNKESLDVVTGIILKRQKKELNKSNSFEENSIDDISKHLKKEQPIWLCINNRQVLAKKVESSQSNSTQLVHSAFPNIDINDFFYDIMALQQGYLVHICRKNYVNELLEKFQEQKACIVGVSLGNSPMEAITPYLDQDEVETTNYQIKTINKSISEVIKRNEEVLKEYQINGLQVSNKQVLSLAVVLQSLLDAGNRITNLIDLSTVLTTNFEQKRFFDQFLKVSGLVILSLLLVNFMFFNHYFNKANDLRQISQMNESSKSKVVSLNESVSKKEKMVSDMLNSGSSKTSWYINQIVKTLPPTILLQEWNYQPLSKRIKENQDILVENGLLTVTGISQDSKVFSQWIEQLEQMGWIKQVMTEYGSETSKSSHFNLDISLFHDTEN